MGFLSEILLSRKKFSSVRKLQQIMAPPNERVHEVVVDLMSLLEKGGTGEKEQALKQFLDLCESEEGVRTVLEREHLTRLDLKKIVLRLLATGLGEWIKGHYVALSTIAYVEPLQYVVRAERQGDSSQQIFFYLLEYWEGRMTSRQLLDLVPQGFATANLAPGNYYPSSLSAPAHE